MSVATKEHRITSSVANTANIAEIVQQLRTRVERQLHELQRFFAAWSVTSPGVHMPNTDVGALAEQRSQRQ